MVIRLQRDLFHGHDVPSFVVDGSVDLTKVSLACNNIDVTLVREEDQINH